MLEQACFWKAEQQEIRWVPNFESGGGRIGRNILKNSLSELMSWNTKDYSEKYIWKLNNKKLYGFLIFGKRWRQNLKEYVGSDRFYSSKLIIKLMFWLTFFLLRASVISLYECNSWMGLTKRDTFWGWNAFEPWYEGDIWSEKVHGLYWRYLNLSKLLYKGPRASPD